jgi:hypothetical protein
MRTITCLALLMLMMVPVHADRATRDAAQAVDEYLGADISSRRRAELKEHLRATDPQVLASGLQRWVRDADTVGDALALATALRVPGLWRAAYNHVDGDHEAAILQYGLVMDERGAADAIWRRWKSLEQDATSWRRTHAALLENPVPVDLLPRAKAVAADETEERREHAADILRRQMVLDDMATADLLAGWRELLADHKISARTFDRAGSDLIPDAPGRRIGRNLLLDDGATLRVPATEEWQSGAYTLVVRLRLPESGEVRVSLSSEQGDWSPVYRDGEWALPTGEHTELVMEATPGGWAELRFEMREHAMQRGATRVRGLRTCRITINGRQLLPASTLNGDMQELSIKVQGERCVFGGADFIGIGQ